SEATALDVRNREVDPVLPRPVPDWPATSAPARSAATAEHGDPPTGAAAARSSPATRPGPIPERSEPLRSRRLGYRRSPSRRTKQLSQRSRQSSGAGHRRREDHLLDKPDP